MFGGKGAQVGQVLFGVRTGLVGQVAQEADHLLGRLGHLGHQRHVGKVPVAQQLCFFMAQGQQLAHDGGVVELFRIALGLFAGAGDVGLVELLAQRAAVRELHHRQVAGHLERELVTDLAIGLRRGGRGLLHVVGHAGQFGCVHIERKGVGGVQRVFAELLRQLGVAFLDGGKTLLGGALQLGAAQHKAAHGVLVGLRLLGRQLGRVHGLVLGVQAFVGAQAGPELGDLGQGLVVGGAQFGRVGHAVEVADCAPGTTQAFGGDVQHLGDARPVGREVGRGDPFQRGAGVGQQGVHGRHDLGRGDGVEQREVGGGEQGVGRGGSVHAVSDGAQEGKFKPGRPGAGRAPTGSDH